jgi:beta-glucosidase
LSYTDFEYHDIEVNVVNDSIQIQFAIKNTGDVSGKEVVQVYVEKMDSDIDRPKQELKAFTKSQLLNPEKQEIMSLQIPITELSYWDENNNKWALEYGSYNIRVGASSRDIRYETQLILNK